MKIAALVLALTLLAGPALAQTERHGADSSFAQENVGLLWAILKGADEESSWAVLRVIHPLQGQQARFGLFGLQASDPLTQEARWLVQPRPLDKVAEVRGRRSEFRELTGRRVLFYETAEQAQANRPALVVFYQGLPDTAPEFLAEGPLAAYLDQAAVRLNRR